MVNHKRKTSSISALDSHPGLPAKRPRTAPGGEGVQPTQQNQDTFSIEGDGKVPKNKAKRLNSATPRGRGRRGRVPSTSIDRKEEDGDEINSRAPRGRGGRRGRRGPVPSTLQRTSDDRNEDQDEFACDSCRLRKLKCDTNPTSCRNCELRKEPCCSTDPISGRAWRRGEAELVELQLKDYERYFQIIPYLEERNRTLANALRQLQARQGIPGHPVMY
ncbi:hypothetical protein V8E54_012124 [Elaphomyces granulatus]